MPSFLHVLASPRNASRQSRPMSLWVPPLTWRDGQPWVLFGKHYMEVGSYRVSLLSGQKVNNSNWLLSSAPSNRSGVAKIADWIGIFSNTVIEKTCSNV